MSADYKPIIRANTVEDLLTTGLGYCCEWFFWGQYENTSADLIAARLGITVNTIRRHRLWYREGRFKCTCKGECLKHRLEELQRNAGGDSGASGEQKEAGVSADLPDLGGVQGGNKEAEE